MSTAVGRLSWVERDAKLVIAARATRSFAQSAVAVLSAIYLGLQVQITSAGTEPDAARLLVLYTMGFVSLSLLLALRLTAPL
jgi:hypothetical protein